MRIRVGSRGSRLARWQADFAAGLLREAEPGTEVEIIEITTQGDRSKEPLAAFSTTGIFVKELERALQDNLIDVAVHSMKDVPLAIPADLELIAFLKRHEPFDALIAREAPSFDALPEGARIGTASLRRAAQLRSRRPDLRIEAIRGNVDTRLRKLDEGEYDAIVLAGAGLERLGWNDRVTEILGWMLPEPGQGILGWECRKGDPLTGILSRHDDPASRCCIRAERKFLEALGGGCHLPIGAYATLDGGRISLEGGVFGVDGKREIRRRGEGPAADPEGLAARLGAEALEAGAASLLES